MVYLDGLSKSLSPASGISAGLTAVHHHINRRRAMVLRTNPNRSFKWTPPGWFPPITSPHSRVA